MSDQTVKPALTPEEWAPYLEGVYVGTREAALRSMAIGNQNAGEVGPWFTWEDVDALRRQADALERSYALASVLVPPKDHEDSTPGVVVVADRFRSIADRIASLLPPREP